ncbi:ATP-binding cassette domain-containing protein [Paenibacillus sp. P26]|nr:ATP-binding cassette domain-containing protein [Paenibacillus sp. P26]
MSDSAVVRLQEVTKRIGGRTIVDRLSFEVRPGEVFGFLGPNGAGKTTTIRMMVGLISMTEGEVLIKGLSVRREFEQAMVHVGAIVENPEFYGFMSGYNNLVHFARMTPGVEKERIDEVVKLVRLENRIHDKVKTYSLGMRQRLGVAQAILHRPAVLVLDEPTNGLDPEGIRELRDYLRRLAQVEGLAVIVSSHLLSEMELMCDRVAIIQNGRSLDVRSFKDAPAGTGMIEVCFEVDAPEAALRLAGAGARLGEGSELIAELADRRDAVAALNAKLVAEGIQVYGIRTQTKTLEEQFLEVTRGIALSSLLRLVQNEQIKIYSRLRTWIMLAIMALSVIGMAILMKYVVETGMNHVLQFMAFASNLTGLAFIFSVIVAGDSVVAEYTWGTIKLLLIRPVSRGKILLAKYISVLLFLLVLLLVLIILSYLAGLLLFGVSGTVSPDSSLPAILQKYGLTAVELVMTVTLAFMISAVFRSALWRSACRFFSCSRPIPSYWCWRSSSITG